MASKKAKTFEEKINAVLKYHEYTHWWTKSDFLPKFAYLEDAELESLLRLGQEIERYAEQVAQGLFSFSDQVVAKDDGRIEAVKATILDKYPYLDAERAARLTAHSIYYAIA